ncbi:MAG: prepilin-type N-terminal cleavage/methylation domain-containing protein [Pseudomonadota bacterium]|nr:prepilin-type N-terminal cleavage/methylation domain-containing protein [Pseudomonadota bacterium]
MAKARTRTSTTGKRTDAEAGYTLIELIVVIVLIGILLSFAVPRLRDDLLNDSLHATARQLVGTAKELRNDAVREQVDFILHFDMGANVFWSSAADMTPEKLDERRRGASPFPPGVRVADIEFGRERVTSDGEARIVFSRHGYVNPAVIHIAKGGRVVTVALAPFLRRIGIHDRQVGFDDLFPASAR